MAAIINRDNGIKIRASPYPIIFHSMPSLNCISSKELLSPLLLSSVNIENIPSNILIAPDRVYSGKKYNKAWNGWMDYLGFSIKKGG